MSMTHHMINRAWFDLDIANLVVSMCPDSLAAKCLVAHWLQKGITA